jgi:hypothetical protein
MARSPLVIKPEWHRDKSGNLVATYIVEEIDPDDQVSAIVVEDCTPDESSTGVISPNRNIRVRIMLQDGSCSFNADFPDWGQALATLREWLNEYGFPECELEDPML